MSAPNSRSLASFAVAGLLALSPLARAQPIAPDDETGDNTDDGQESVPSAPIKSSAAHTMATVSQEFLRDPQGWPKLWALNPEIPNPHWIYQGQVVRVGGTNSVKEPSVPDRSITL